MLVAVRAAPTVPGQGGQAEVKTEQKTAAVTKLPSPDSTVARLGHRGDWLCGEAKCQGRLFPGHPGDRVQLPPTGESHLSGRPHPSGLQDSPGIFADQETGCQVGRQEARQK